MRKNKQVQQELKQLEDFMVKFLSGCNGGLEQLARVEWVSCIVVSFLKKYLVSVLEETNLDADFKPFLQRHLDITNQFLSEMQPRKTGKPNG